MHVVHFLHAGRVVVKLVHDACQIAVHCPEDGDSQTEVAAPEERLSLLLTHALHLFAVLRNPSRAAAHHLYVVGKGTHVIVISRLRGGELYGHIGRAEGFAVPKDGTDRWISHGRIHS